MLTLELLFNQYQWLIRITCKVSNFNLKMTNLTLKFIMNHYDVNFCRGTNIKWQFYHRMYKITKFSPLGHFTKNLDFSYGCEIGYLHSIGSLPIVWYFHHFRLIFSISWPLQLILDLFIPLFNWLYIFVNWINTILILYFSSQFFPMGDKISFDESHHFFL